VDGPAGLPVPEDGGLPLVGDADGGKVVGVNARLGNDLHHHGVLGGPDLHSVVLHPTLMGIKLGEFLLTDPNDVLRLVKEDRP
jgi:hypothetical protein